MMTSQEIVIDVQSIAYALALSALAFIIYIGYRLQNPARLNRQQIAEWIIWLAATVFVLLLMFLVFFTRVIPDIVLAQLPAIDDRAAQEFSVASLAAGVLGSIYGATGLLGKRKVGPPNQQKELPGPLHLITLTCTLSVFAAAWAIVFGLIEEKKGCAYVYCAPVRVTLAEQIGHPTFIVIVGAFIGILVGACLAVVAMRLNGMNTEKPQLTRHHFSLFAIIGGILFVLLLLSDIAAVGPPSISPSPIFFVLQEALLSVGTVLLLVGSQYLAWVINKARDNTLATIGLFLIMIGFMAQAIVPVATLLRR